MCHWMIRMIIPISVGMNRHALSSLISSRLDSIFLFKSDLIKDFLVQQPFLVFVLLSFELEQRVFRL